MKFSSLAGLAVILCLLPQFASAAGRYSDGCGLANDVVREGVKLRVLLDSSVKYGFMSDKDRPVFCAKVFEHSKEMNRSILEAFNHITDEGSDLKKDVHELVRQGLGFEERARSYCSAEVAPDDLRSDLLRYFDETIVARGATLYVSACGSKLAEKTERKLAREEFESQELKAIFGSRPQNHSSSGDNEIPGTRSAR